VPVRKYAYYLFSIGKLLAGIRNWPLVVRIFLRRAPPGPQIIRLRESGVQFRVRGAMDVWIVKETYLDRFYERFGTPIGDGWTVVDVGAGIGDFTLRAALGHPENRVYAFEPFPESFALLQENLRLNRAPNVQAFAEAIGGQTGTLALDLSSGEPLQFSTEGKGTPEKALAVPCLSLADAWQRLALARCDVLKLDCEGAEYDILFQAPDAVLDGIEHIVMEYHDGVTGHSHQDLVEFLSARGFQARTQPSPVHAHLGFLYAKAGPRRR
jgi:FkbM family methyltransferase